MDYVGLFALGAFVGAIATVGLRYIRSVHTWMQGLATMIAATLSGTALLFVGHFNNSKALGAYPVGLLIALMWAYADVALKNIKSPEKPLRKLGYLHIYGVAAASVLAVGLVLFLSIRDNWNDTGDGKPAAASPAAGGTHKP